MKTQLRLESLDASFNRNLKRVAILSKNYHDTKKLLMKLGALKYTVVEPAVAENSEEVTNSYVDNTLHKKESVLDIVPLNPEITPAKSQSTTTMLTSTAAVKDAETAKPQAILETRGLDRSLWTPTARPAVVSANLPTTEPTSENFAEKFAAAAAKFSIKIGPVVLSARECKRERSLLDS